MNEAQRRAAALKHLKKTTISYPEWLKRKKDPKYNAAGSEWGQALALLAPDPPAAPKPPTPTNVFAGVGVFTAWDPGVVLRNRPKVDWVAVTTDLFHGTPGCTPTMAAQLRAAGYTVHVWESRMERGAAALVLLGGIGYIGQAENEPELRQCLDLTLPPGPRALVGNPSAWQVESQQAASLQGWQLLLETYWNEQESLEPDSRGYPISSFVLGLYPGAAGRKTLAQYRTRWPSLSSASWSAYLGEELGPDDWALIGRKP